jgi:hypothetical protein
VVVLIPAQKVAWRYALPMTLAAILDGYLGLAAYFYLQR